MLICFEVPSVNLSSVDREFTFPLSESPFYHIGWVSVYIRVMMMRNVKMIFIAILRDSVEFMDDYFHTGLLIGCVSAFFYLMFLVCRDFDTGNISKKKVIQKSWKIPFIVLLGFYGCLVLGITVFSREKGTKYILNLVPFSTWETDSRYLIFWVENLLLLMPLGMLLGFWLCKGAGRILSFFRWSAFQSKRAD